MPDDNSADGLTFALRAEAQVLDEDRPCAYCNPDSLVNERVAEAKKQMNEAIENEEQLENPLPSGVRVRIGFASGDTFATIESHRQRADTGLTYKTKEHGLVEHWIVEEVISVPEEQGICHADYVFTFGHEDGAGVEVPVCDMCLDGAPVEFNDETVRDNHPYEYGGDGAVVEPTTEVQDGTVVHTREAVEQ